ncbi:MAG: LPS biosynthesis glycosyltransferase [Elainellaceae cyanobacterium]
MTNLLTRKTASGRRDRPDPLHLANQIDRVLIIAYKESTTLLEQSLNQAGLPCEVLRQEDRPEYRGYAAIYRCLLNHHRAWERAAAADRPTMVVEADFVPVANIGELPLPFDPHQADVGMAWLYTCAPQLYSVTPQGFGEGYSASTVAYVVTPQGAQQLLDLVDSVTQMDGTDYSNFDSRIDPFLRDRHFKNYIPFRNYGEHGGRPNPEHRRHGMSGIHRADVLAGRLAFLPLYAFADEALAAAPADALPEPTWADWGRYLQARAQARLKGWGRLAWGKFLRPKVVRRSSVPRRLVWFALARQFSRHL